MADMQAKIRISILDGFTAPLQSMASRLRGLLPRFGAVRGAANVSAPLKQSGSAFAAFDRTAVKALRHTGAQLGQTSRDVQHFEQLARLREATAGVTRFDRVATTSLRHVGSEFGKLERKSGSVRSSMSSLADATIALGGLKSVASGALGVLATPIQKFADLDESQAVLASKTHLERSSPEFQQLEQQSDRIAKTSKFSQTEVSGTQTNFASAGFTPAEIMKAVPSTINFAIGGRMAPEEAAAITTTSKAQFGLDAGQVPMIHDVLTAAADSSSADIRDFGAALVEVGPSAAALQMTFSETAAYLATLADQGRGASKGGTSLNALFERMIAPTEQAQEAMRELGLSAEGVARIQKLAATGHGTDALRELADLNNKAAPEKSAELRKKIFETEGSTAFNIIAKDMGEKDASGVSKFDKRLQTVAIGSSGANDEQAFKMSQHLNAKKDNALGAIDALVTKIGSLFAPEVTALSEKTQQTADSLSKLTDAEPGLVKTGAAIGVGATALAGIGATLAKFAGLSSLFSAVGAGAGAAGAVGGGVAAGGAVAGGTVAAGTTAAVAGGGVAAAGGATALAAAATAAAPFVLGALALGGLGAGVYYATRDEEPASAVAERDVKRAVKSESPATPLFPAGAPPALSYPMLQPSMLAPELPAWPALQPPVAAPTAAIAGASPPQSETPVWPTLRPPVAPSNAAVAPSPAIASAPLGLVSEASDTKERWPGLTLSPSISMPELAAPEVSAPVAPVVSIAAPPAPAVQTSVSVLAAPPAPSPASAVGPAAPLLPDFAPPKLPQSFFTPPATNTTPKQAEPLVSRFVPPAQQLAPAPAASPAPAPEPAVRTTRVQQSSPELERIARDTLRAIREMTRVMEQQHRETRETSSRRTRINGSAQIIGTGGS